MPKWIYTTIGGAFTTITGNTPSKADATLFGTFMPLVKPPELCDAPLDAAEDGISETGARFARAVPPGAVLISCIGNLGKVGITTVPVAFNQQINAVVPDPAKAIPEFIFYQALSPAFKNHLEEKATGTTVRIVNKSKFNDIPIVLPPLAEQQRIVAILDEAFEGIATAKANTEKNLQNALELFEGHLQSIFSIPGHGWQARTLEELGTITSSKRIFKDEYVEAGIPFYRTKEVKELANGLEISTELFITESRYNEIKSDFGVPQKGDILLTAK